MEGISYIANAPDEFTLSGDTATSKVQIAKTGVFKDPRYGKFSITLADFDKWISNFHTLAKADGRIGLPVDVDHSPEKKGETEAAGWITALHKQGNELWATVEWNTLGRELVGDRRYAYISPSYQHNYADETGKRHGTALVGVALTNRPFLSMATVSLSKDWTFAQEVDDINETGKDAASDSPEDMPDFKNIATKMGLSADADEATILAKAEELLARPTEAQNVNLSELAKAEGKVLVDGTQLSALVADAAAGKAAADELRSQKFETAFDKALSQGRMTPAQKEMMKDLYDLDADKTLAAMAAAPQVVQTTLSGTAAGPGNGSIDAIVLEAGGQAVDDDRVALHERAMVLSREHSIDYDKAVEMAVLEG